MRALDAGNRRVGDIMTPRTEVDWIDFDDSHDEVVKTLRESRHEQLLVSRGNIDELVGAVSKRHLLNQLLAGSPLDLEAVIGKPLLVHEATPVFKVLDEFKQAPVRLAVVVDEYGGLEGIVTQADLLEALAGELAEAEGGRPDVQERADGSLLIDGMASAGDIFNRLALAAPSTSGRFHTIAGFALAQLGHLPVAGEKFSYEGWSFEIVDMDGRRIDKLLVHREVPPLDEA